MAPKQPLEPWHSFLSEIDSLIDEEVCLHCLGGFVITQIYGLERPTADVDTLSIRPRNQAANLVQLAGKESKLHAKYKIYLDFVTICTPPDEYDSRLTEMFSATYKHLRLFALDPYDLALAKIERNSGKDREDVKRLARKIKLDPAILKERYEKELQPYLGNPKREDLTLEIWIEMIEEDSKRS
jgi:hypothetical protein